MFCFLDTYKEKRYTVLITGEKRIRMDGSRQAFGGSQTCTVEGTLAPRTSRQERRGVLEDDIIFRKKVYQ